MVNDNKMNNSPPWALICLSVVIALALTAGGYWFYRCQLHSARESRYNELKAIAELKVNQIVAWRQERLADARINSSGIIRQYMLQWHNLDADADLRARICDCLQEFGELQGYQNLILAGVDGRLLLSLDPRLTALHPHGEHFVAEAVSSRNVVFGDFFRCPVCGQIHLDVAAPIFDNEKRPVAVLIQRIDPQQYLYPLLQSWPTPSQSAETLILRKDGDDALFLNPLRHGSVPPLTMRVPLSRTDVPGVQAALGKTGRFEGRDYRGVEVLADILPVPNSPWFMVAKVDLDEILAEAHYRGGLIGLLTLVTVLLTGLGMGFVYKHKTKRTFQALYHAEQERREAQEEIRATLYGIGDGVIATDSAGRVSRMNPVAEALTGWREAEALGTPLPRIFRILNETTHARVEDPVERVLREGMVVGLANHTLLIARDGSEHPIADSGAPIRNENGEITGVVLVFRDQTEEREYLAALEASENRFRQISTTISDIAYSCHLGDEDVYVIDWMIGAAEKITGYSIDEIKAKRCWRFLVIEEDIPLFEKHVGSLTPGRTGSCELRARHKSGKIVWLASVAQCVSRPQGTEHQVLYGALIDITGRKQAEEALKRSELAHRTLTQNVPEIVYRLYCKEHWKTEFYNEMLQRFTGYDPNELLHSGQCSVGPLILPGDLDAVVATVKRAILERAPFEAEYRIKHKNGIIRHFLEHGRPVLGEDGEPAYIDGVIADITERKLAERERALLADTISVSLNEIYLFDAETLRFRFVNHGALRNLGYSLEEIQRMSPLDLKPEFTVDSFQEIINPLFQGEKPVQVFETVHRRADGSLYPVEVHLQLFDHDDERIFLAVIQDISARKQAESELRKLTMAVDQSPASVMITDLHGNVEYVNPKFTEVTGYTLDEVRGQNPRILKSGETSTEEYETLWDTIRSGGEWHGVLHNRKKDGSLFWERASISPIRDVSGTITHFIAVKEDITAQKALEDQLRQAQKLESVGRLAGGVAHDFNNMLGVIIGHTEIAMMSADPSSSIHRNLQEIIQASQRSADFVRQLLAFARKQTVSPKVVDLNDAVSGMLKMLQRLMGEEIDVIWTPGHELWQIKIDPSQVDQLLANLAVNARDAIAGIGKFTIETKNVVLDEVYCTDHVEATVGEYVLMSVSDDGCGMNPETLANIFEPFFTTKGVGQGTGLGLSTVYGIVKQNSGFINVYSEPDLGTIFKLYFPRHLAAPLELLHEEAVRPVPKGTETVVLVEDETAILSLGQTILEGLGYTVLTARTPGEALRVAAEHTGPIHLLITDVVMPEMNGRELSERLGVLRPDMKCLYMSGYTADIISHRGILDENVHFIQKPFSMRGLAERVREALGQ